MTRDEYSNTIKEYVGENTDERTIKFVDTVMKAYDEINNRVKNQDEMVTKTEYEALNNSWAKKYRDRFFEPTQNNIENEIEKTVSVSETEKTYTYENLFN